ncbi:MAG: asparaginase [Pelagibacteraceae bacterium]
MKTVSLVNVTRGKEIESSHSGAAVFIDSSGKVLREWGDSSMLIYPRSSLKPIQSLNLYKNKIDEKLKLEESYLAFSTASHHGEDIHVNKAENWLKQLGLKEEDLACGEDWPKSLSDKFKAEKKYKHKRKVFHNCSGKHCAHLAVAKARDLPIKNYQKENHLIQSELIELIEELSQEKIHSMGIDGCTLPNPFMSLKSFALISARFADFKYLREHGSTAQKIFNACIKFPELTGGEKSINCLLTKAAGNIFFKNGAEGVYVALIPHLKSAIALKISDGTQRASEIAMAGIIDELNLMPKEKINSFLSKPILNSANDVVGNIEFNKKI